MTQGQDQVVGLWGSQVMGSQGRARQAYEYLQAMRTGVPQSKWVSPQVSATEYSALWPDAQLGTPSMDTGQGSGA